MDESICGIRDQLFGWTEMNDSEKSGRVPWNYSCTKSNWNEKKEGSVKGAIHPQLNRAILLCESIADGKTE